MIIGIDTSNYTTSVAAVCGDNFINIRKILQVGKGQRGLRQSDAVFSHIKAFPELFSELRQRYGGAVEAVGVSTRPRSVPGSYMPVFLAGEAFACTAAESLGVPLYRYSHQDGHIMAGIFSSGKYDFLDGERFAAVHLSGGTTEILISRYNGRGFDCEIAGGTKDISAGQLIDRVGVMLGMDFPCGAALSALAETAEDSVRLPVTVNGGWLNMSGTESKAQQIFEKTPAPVIARGVLDAVAHSVTRAVNNVTECSGTKRVLFAGGVASNKLLREYVKAQLDAEAVFASAELSTDNAVGTAKLAEYEFKNRDGT